ncbi:hypothetical protein [Methylobacterium sp. SD21]|uniref:hypothetical protein n=1 Tax=Methylobacterium litchii TaxID=3138810 RepID=UPI00313D2F7B
MILPSFLTLTSAETAALANCTITGSELYAAVDRYRRQARAWSFGRMRGAPDSMYVLTGLGWTEYLGLVADARAVLFSPYVSPESAVAAGAAGAALHDALRTLYLLDASRSTAALAQVDALAGGASNG